MTKNATQEGVDAYLRKRHHGETIMALGVDPGIGHTGWAVILWPTRKIVAIGTERIPEADTLVALGDVWAANPVALVAVQTPISEGKMAFWNADKHGSRKGIAALCRNIEFSGRIAGYFEALLFYGTHGVPVVRVEPKRGCGLKAPMELWQSAWDYTGRTSQDARDAAVIAAMGCVEIGGAK